MEKLNISAIQDLKKLLLGKIQKDIKKVPLISTKEGN